jgi:hypothetical protein
MNRNKCCGGHPAHKYEHCKKAAVAAVAAVAEK